MAKYTTNFYSLINMGIYTKADLMAWFMDYELSDYLTQEEITAMKAQESDSFGYNTDPIVSCDIIGSTYGSIFDATQTMVTKIADDLYQVQVVAWYDNENSYTSQMVRTIKYFAELSK